ncbi:MAG TPA: PRC-barrel domain-containing protein [Chloroflexia bacterium]
MRKGKNVIGKDVISYMDGVKLHSVKDLVIGMDNETVVALLVEEGGLLSSAKVVPMENVASFGKDAVVIADSGAAIPADNYPAVQQILDLDDKLIGKKVFTEGGDEQGSISDLYFEESSGRILGFEVSGGLIKNVQKGTSYLDIDDIVNVGPDVVLIKSEAVYALDAQVGGLQGAIETAKEKAGEAKDKVGEAAGDVKNNVKDAAQDPQAGVQQRAEDAVIGRRAGTDVEADNGSVIVAAGQRIGNAEVEAARGQGKLEALLASAGLGQAQGAGSGAGEALGQAGDNIGQAAAQAGDAAGNVWDNFTRKFSEWTDSAGKRMDEEKTKQRLATIQDAVGRPVTKVILDRQDSVILNLGDIITHEAVQKSFDAGMLDTLLDNVYKGDVTFERDEMRVQEEAQATVEKASGNATVVQEMEQNVEQAQQEREQQKEQKRAEAEQGREQRAQEREQSTQQREAGDSSSSTKPVAVSQRGGKGEGEDSSESMTFAPTEQHTQASSPEGQFNSQQS